MNRSISLDTLRGMAIIAMVLSGTLAFGQNVPVWMYHVASASQALMPPSPKLALSWNDWIFPFFIFSMGAAIPLALTKRIQAGEGSWRIVLSVTLRCFLLLFFGIFLEHVKPFVIRTVPTAYDWFIGLTGCVLLVTLYFRFPSRLPPRWVWAMRIAALLLGVGLMFSIRYPDRSGFDLYRSDFLIILIANNAFFGSLIWYFTRTRPVLRMAVLPFIFSILMAGDLTSSLNKIILDASPVPWIYHFDYLGYLFIVLPGTLCGDFLLKHEHDFSSSVEGNIVEPEDQPKRIAMVAGILLLVLSNIVLLHLRLLVVNMISSTVIILTIIWAWYGIEPPHRNYYKKYMQLGSYMLFLGIFFEAYQGGLRKVYSTFSYFFFSTALAAFILLCIIIFFDLNLFRRALTTVSMIGKNPIVAYIAANLLIIPLYHFLGIVHLFVPGDIHTFEGWISGLLNACLVAAVAILFTSRNWYLRT